MLDEARRMWLERLGEKAIRGWENKVKGGLATVVKEALFWSGPTCAHLVEDALCCRMVIPARTSHIGPREALQKLVSIAASNQVDMSQPEALREWFTEVYFGVIGKAALEESAMLNQLKWKEDRTKEEEQKFKASQNTQHELANQGIPKMVNLLWDLTDDLCEQRRFGGAPSEA